MARKLSAELAAALASGAKLESLPEGEGNTPDEVTAPEVVASTGEETSVATAPEPAEEAPAAAPVSALSEVLGELRSANAELATAKAEVAKLQGEVAELNDSTVSAKNVVLKSIQGLSVALKASTVGLDSMSLSALCTHYNQLRTEFETKFPIGGIASPAAPDLTTKPNADGKNAAAQAERQRRIDQSRSARK